MRFNEFESRRFSRAYKKLSKNVLSALHDAMDLVLDNPNIGEEKRGDLKGIYIFKFKVARNEFLLGYSFNSGKKKITWEAIGPHENFYRTLKG